ncbi:MAG: glycolate oxidase subunit GlcF [Rhodocyclaceae bacterium]|nr:glycolate oxidase subunit GlcF [Rhodocyclaceae bacterium]
MQTNIAPEFKNTRHGREAEQILRTCVHCGFCTATCPTYQLLGDELDGPRGRIYLMKQLLEGGEVTEKTRLHLDRCLTCRSCESTCPSGVRYGRLVDIGREIVEARVPRSGAEKYKRVLLREGLTRTGLFAAGLAVGRALRPFLPAALKNKLPAGAQRAGAWPAPRHTRRLIALAGCVQPALAPDINAATARVLDRIGISLIEAPGAGCCGAVRFHLNDHQGGLEDARRNVDAWLPLLDQGCEGIVMTASGCGAFVRDYGHILEDDASAGPAARVALETFDLSEILARERDALLALLGNRKPGSGGRIAFHPPCTLQHGQKIRGVVESLLTAAGYELVPVQDSHLCCGSAGTYSLLQPELSERLRANKVAALSAAGPQLIASANIGCISHIAGGTQLPVRHWIELIDAALAG